MKKMELWNLHNTSKTSNLFYLLRERWQDEAEDSLFERERSII